MSTMQEYLRLVAEHRERMPERRYGQCLFNALNELQPALASRIRGTNKDAYYLDSRAERMLAYLAAYWPKDEPVKVDAVDEFERKQILINRVTRILHSRYKENALVSDELESVLNVILPMFEARQNKGL